MRTRFSISYSRSGAVALVLVALVTGALVGPNLSVGASQATTPATGAVPVGGTVDIDAPLTVLVSSGTVHLSTSASATLVNNAGISTFGTIRVLAEATAHVDYEILSDSLHIAQYNGQVRLSEAYEVPGLHLTLKVTEADALPAGQNVTWAVYGLPSSTEGGVALGDANTATSTTSINNTANDSDVLVGRSDGAGTGVRGMAAAGQGIRGEATSGTGGYFTSQTGTALNVVGKAKFTRSKRVNIGAGKSSLKVTLAGVTTSSLVFAVLHSNRSGYYVRAVVPSTGYFTVYLNKATTSSTNYVAYFVVN